MAAWVVEGWHYNVKRCDELLTWEHPICVCCGDSRLNEGRLWEQNGTRDLFIGSSAPWFPVCSLHTMATIIVGGYFAAEGPVDVPVASGGSKPCHIKPLPSMPIAMATLILSPMLSWLRHLPCTEMPRSFSLIYLGLLGALGSPHGLSTEGLGDPLDCAALGCKAEVHSSDSLAPGLWGGLQSHPAALR